MLAERAVDLGCLLSGWSRMLKRDRGGEESLCMYLLPEVLIECKKRLGSSGVLWRHGRRGLLSQGADL